MKTTDIIRAVLDVVDGLTNDDQEPEDYQDPDSEQSRFRQILSQLDQRDCATDYDNSPNASISDTDSVTSDAGGGMNRPKHPDDIRVKDPRQDG